MRLEDITDKAMALTHGLIDGQSIQIGAVVVCSKWSSDSRGESHGGLWRLQRLFRGAGVVVGRWMRLLECRDLRTQVLSSGLQRVEVEALEVACEPRVHERRG